MPRAQKPADVGEDAESDVQDGGGDPQFLGKAVDALAQFAFEFEAEEVCAVQQEDGNGGQSAEQAIGIEQGEQVAREHHVLVDRHAARQVGKGRAEQKGSEEGADGDHPVEAVAPGGSWHLSSDIQRRCRG